MRYSIIILLTNITFVSANDYYPQTYYPQTYYPQTYYEKPQVIYTKIEKAKIDNRVKVTTKQLKLEAPIQKQNEDQEELLQEQWDTIISAIPIPARQNQANIFKRHKFQNNIGEHKAIAKIEQNIQTRTRQKVYFGYIKQSFAVKNKNSITTEYPTTTEYIIK